MLAPNSKSRKQPVAVLGAGDLVSHLHRGDDAEDRSNYRFNVFRLTRELNVTSELRAGDLRNLIKLCQVLAFTIAEDGWIPMEERAVLRELFDDLDVLTQRWSDSDHV